MTKKSKQIIILIFSIILIVILYNIYIYVRNNSVDYQMDKLQNGNTEEKIRAISYLSDNKITDVVPLLIENIDNENRGFWAKDPKGGLETISCVATFELQSLTSNNLGSTCYWDTETDNDKVAIIKKWKEWYNNNYTK